MKNTIKTLTTLYFLSILFSIGIGIFFVFCYPHSFISFMRILSFAVFIMAIFGAIAGILVVARVLAVLTLKMLPQKKVLTSTE